jgi:hypothetical protein
MSSVSNNTQVQPQVLTGIDGGVPATDVGGIPMGGDVLLKLYELQMNYVNGRMDAVMNQMESANKRSEALNALDAALAKYPNGIDKDDPSAQQKWEDLNKGFLDAENKLPPGDPMRDQIEQLRMSKEMRWGGGSSDNMGDRLGGGKLDPNGRPGDYILGQGDVQSLQKSVGGMLKDLDAQNQKLGMAASVFSNQLTQMATLFSGIEQARHQAEMAPINNIGKG